ncbi:Ku protein [Pseudomonas taiwanensis]|uniref:non-homologous end joining protein Ku n=1 Tax=Pseudomonas taiwanensis TaxID=470150 RepID=UPI0015BC1343|nr:Ku protein [Pseudomonas taiwanensis]NWL76483.1 Ku protein [Pseudomonas taiwanensis]
MARAIWKGAISFGLVHIPVALVSASESSGIDFDWLDKRSMEPVGYKRVNKITGKEIQREDIVKGVEYGDGHYVVLSDDEIRQAHPESTQTIDIIAFVEATQIPLQNIEAPYYLSPDKRGGKVYALLREALEASGKVALAEVVLRTRQHLAALMPMENALVLVMLRWPSEVRKLDVLDLGSDVTNAKLSKGEMQMASRLIEDMTTDWEPESYVDTFSEKVMELAEQKAKAGKIERVEQPGEETTGRGAEIIDLTELLRRSLGGKGKGGKATEETEEAEAAPRRRAGGTARKPAKASRK